MMYRAICAAPTLPPSHSLPFLFLFLRSFTLWSGAGCVSGGVSFVHVSALFNAQGSTGGAVAVGPWLSQSLGSLHPHRSPPRLGWPHGDRELSDTDLGRGAQRGHLNEASLRVRAVFPTGGWECPLCNPPGATLGFTWGLRPAHRCPSPCPDKGHHMCPACTGPLQCSQAIGWGFRHHFPVQVESWSQHP